MAIEMPKFSASRPASSMNGSRSRWVSHGQRSDDRAEGHDQPGEGRQMRGHRGVADRLVHRTGSGGLVGAAPGEVGAALRAGWYLVVQPGRAGRTRPVHDRSFTCAHLGRLVGMSSTIGRQAVSVVSPRATLGARPAGEAEARCHPQEEPARPRPSTGLVPAGRCRLQQPNPASGEAPT
jgi:hypothetical protein